MIADACLWNYEQSVQTTGNGTSTQEMYSLWLVFFVNILLILNLPFYFQLQQFLLNEERTVAIF